MINELKSYIKLLDDIIESPEYNIRIFEMKTENPEYAALVKMGFLKYNSENESFAIPYEAREIVRGLYTFNHPEIRREKEERRKITKSIIEGTKNFNQ